MKCETEKVERSAKFKANTSTKAKDYTLTLTVRGKTATVDHLKVVEAGRSVTKTTVTTTTVPFTCSGNVTVTGTVSVTGSAPTYVTWVRGTLTNSRNIAIYDVEITFVLVPTNGDEMGNTVIVDIPGSVARGQSYHGLEAAHRSRMPRRSISSGLATTPMTLQGLTAEWMVSDQTRPIRTGAVLSQGREW